MVSRHAGVSPPSMRGKLKSQTGTEYVGISRMLLRKTYPRTWRTHLLNKAKTDKSILKQDMVGFDLVWVVLWGRGKELE